jgi:1-acyl-sn-glycerol-3-phosphate acyltransferase
VSLIKTILIFIPVVVGALVLLPIALLCLIIRLLGLRELSARLIYRAAQGWARMMLFLSGCKVTLSGREHIPRKGGICFVSNHGSIFDIILILAYAGRPFGFIAKKELAFVPIIDLWIPLLGGFFIDRKNIRKAVRTINKGINRIKAGGAMIIFPEGHRSRGQGLLPFHPGSLKLATQAEAPIVPLALSGSYDVFERTYRLKPGPVGVHFAPPLPTATLAPEERKQVLANRVRDIIAGMLGEA